MNKYEVVKTLGQGGYGKANLVRRKTDKKLFVVKEVRLTSLSQKDRDDAIQEAKLLASLRHPYIVEYEESFQERGVLFIIMGYADGGDLSKKIESRGTRLFSEEEVLHDFIEIALAIKYIHDRKILHRDLKGQNIFLLKDGTIKLGDFGISRILEHTFNYCRTQIGTPYYLSPEICQGRNYNFKTDIWSLGCILYELCALKHAFQAGNMKQLMMNIIQTKHPPIPPNFSQDIRNLIDRMLMKEPEKRPNINQILKTPFIQKRLSMYLEKTMLEYEMGHTKLRDRKPFAPPTIIISKEKQLPAPPPSQHQPKPSRNEYDERQKRLEEQERQIKMRQLALQKKEAELAMKEKAMKEKNRREVQHQAVDNRNKEDEMRAMQFYEQKRKMLENKAKMQHEMSGNNMKYALQNQFDSDSYYYSDYYDDDRGGKGKQLQNKNQKASNYEQMAREDFFEKQRLARANRERMKREELQGGQMQRALMMAQEDEDDDKPRNRNQDNKNKNNDNYDEIARVMRENRRQAAENKRKLEEAERGLAAKEAMVQGNKSKRMKTITKKKKNPQDDDYYYYSDYYSDYSDPPPKPKPKPKPQEQQPQPPKQSASSQSKAKPDPNDINEYMRQLRHERLANLQRAKEAEQKAKEEELLSKNKKAQNVHAEEERDKNAQLGKRKEDQKFDNDVDDYETPPQKEKKVEMTDAERNAFMREERHQRRANKARIEAMGRVDMDQIIAQAEAQQRANPSLDITDHDQQVNQNEMVEDDEPPPQKEKKVELTQAERNAYMREERHQRRANKARIEAMGKINMDQLIAQAEAEQRANPRIDDTPSADDKGNEQNYQDQDDEPPPQKEKKVEMTQAERNAYMREERHQRRANKARIEAMGKINMDQIIAQAEAEQRANPRIDDTPASEDKGNEQNYQEQDDEPPPQKEKKVEMTQAERNAYMREERHQRRANKAKLEAMGKIDMDQLIAQAEAEQRANPLPAEPPKPVEAPKPKEKPQEPPKVKKSPRLLGDDVTEAIRSGRFTNQNQTNSDQKMTVAEARRKQKQPQPAAAPPAETTAKRKNTTGSQAHLLDKEQMRELFQKKRENLRQNHEKIKVAQDGSRDPNLIPASQSTSSHVSSSASALTSSRGRMLIKSDTKKKMTKSSSVNKEDSGKKNTLKPDVATFAEEVPESNDSNKIDLSQALNMKSTGEFLKSRSLVLDQLANEEDINEDETQNNQEELDSIRERADVFNAALDINDDDLADSLEQQNSEDDLNPGMKYYLENKGVKLPAISDHDSMSYRAEVIRAFLEEKVGIDKVVALRTAVMDKNGADELDKLFAGMDPGLIALAQQLFMMDDTMECCAM